MFESEISDYEDLRREYRRKVMDAMGCEEYGKYNEVLYSAHSCAIEGNSFSVDDTRELKEKGLGVIPVGKSLLEALHPIHSGLRTCPPMQNKQVCRAHADMNICYTLLIIQTRIYILRGYNICYTIKQAAI